MLLVDKETYQGSL